MGDDSTIMIKIGPAGTYGGDSWDEKGRDKIVQIFICHDKEIESIQFQYAENGLMKLSERFGYNFGCNFNIVKLNYPTEHITWISGSYTNSSICSITFGTNSGKYGPFGRNVGKEFKIEVGEHQFGGFHGTYDNMYGVKSIGVYLKPNMTLDYKVNKNIVKPVLPDIDY